MSAVHIFSCSLSKTFCSKGLNWTFTTSLLDANFGHIYTQIKRAVQRGTNTPQVFFLITLSTFSLHFHTVISGNYRKNQSFFYLFIFLDHLSCLQGCKGAGADSSWDSASNYVEITTIISFTSKYEVIV